MSYRIIRNNLIDSDILWRYMDLPKFLSLLSSKSLWFARSDTFKDKREGIFHPAMKAELDNFYEDFKNKGKFPPDSEIKSSSDFQQYLSDNTYISCWHKNTAESMVMWELYGQSENSVAIKTTVGKLERSFDLHEVYKVALEFALDEIQYIDHASSPSHRNYRQPFFIKRPYFGFEQEARLYLMSRYKKSRGEAPIGHSIKADINVLIDSIYVHPDSEAWFYNSVKDLVEKYELDKPVKRGISGNKF